MLSMLCSYAPTTDEKSYDRACVPIVCHGFKPCTGVNVRPEELRDLLAQRQVKFEEDRIQKRGSFSLP